MNKNNLEQHTSRTKKLFADAFYRLAKKKPVEKIFVKDICLEAGMKRQSFYYHFKDKYDLIAWMFMQLFMDEVKHAKVINNEEMMINMLKKVKERESFFYSAMLDSNQNNFFDYLSQMYINLEFEVLRKYLKTDKLDDEIIYDIKSYTYACNMHGLQWCLHKEKMTLESFAYHMYRTMPKLLKEAYNDLNY